MGGERGYASVPPALVAISSSISVFTRTSSSYWSWLAVSSPGASSCSRRSKPLAAVYEYRIERDGERVADGYTRHATVDRDTYRPTRVPAWLADAIAMAEASSE